jgi:uncharacterized protein (DUF169 family)
VADWELMGSEIQDMVKLRTMPIGMKFLEKMEDMDKIPKLRRPDTLLTFCQAITMSRTIRLTLGITANDLAAPGCLVKLGFAPVSQDFKETMYSPNRWVKTQKDADKFLQEERCMPLGKFKAVVLSPLASGRLDPPDIVLIYATPAQLMVIMTGLQWEDYKPIKGIFKGEGTCSDSFIDCYHSGEPQFTVPCFGERNMGHVQEEEMSLAIPGTMVKKTVEGMKAMRESRMVAYPIPFLGFQLDITSKIAKVYPQSAEIRKGMLKEARFKPASEVEDE